MSLRAPVTACGRNKLNAISTSGGDLSTANQVVYYHISFSFTLLLLLFLLLRVNTSTRIRAFIFGSAANGQPHSRWQENTRSSPPALPELSRIKILKNKLFTPDRTDGNKTTLIPLQITILPIVRSKKSRTNTLSIRL